MNSLLATLSPFPLIRSGPKGTEGSNRLNSRESLREKMDQPHTLVYLTPLSASASKGQCTVELPSPGEGMNKEYPCIGDPALPVNAQIQKPSRTDNHNDPSQVRFDKDFI
jgi:hypothetical protein